MIVHLLEDWLFVTDCTLRRLKFSMTVSILQCTTIDTDSEVPQHIAVATTVINDFVFSDERIPEGLKHQIFFVKRAKPCAVDIHSFEACPRYTVTSQHHRAIQVSLSWPCNNCIGQLQFLLDT